MKSKKKMNKRKLIAFIAGASAIAILAVGSTVAYFTDRVNGNASQTARNVQVELTNLKVNDSNVIVAPGAIIPFTYTVGNKGSLALDEKETITLTFTDASGSPLNLNTPAEFDIYEADDVELVDGFGYQAKSGKSPIAATTVNGNKRVVTVPQTTLNNTGNELSDSSIKTSVDKNFVVLFDRWSLNDFMDCTITADVVVEAKQHIYTSGFDDNWSQLQKSSVILTNGTTVDAVPSKAEHPRS